MNDTNPYAAPVPVEEDDPGYDLRKIARLYNRLGATLKWFWLLLVIYISVIVVAQLFFCPSIISVCVQSRQGD